MLRLFKPAYMKHILSLSLLTLMIIGYSCKKEYSQEEGSGNKSEGSLLSEITGECLPKTVTGAYIAGTTLDASNYIEVDVDVTKEGSYTIITDTINGYYFTASGDFTNTGINTVKLFGKGKPLAEGSDFFMVSYDSTSCEVEIEVLPSSASGPASFTLETSGTDCMDAVVSGTYIKGTVLNSTNKVTIDVNVTAIGTYSITTTTVNGIKFSGVGAFTTIGAQTITLAGSGTPLNVETSDIPVTVGASSCSFSVDIEDGGTNPPPTNSSIFWKFTYGSQSYQGSIDPSSAQLTTIPIQGFTITSFTFSGSLSTADTAITIILGDIAGGINNNETYSVTASTSANNVGAALTYGGTIYEANPQISGSSFTLKITNHNSSTKTITGTFSGTLKSGSQSLTITNGQFSVQYS
jgi:hypothetical protein